MLAEYYRKASYIEAASTPLELWKSQHATADSGTAPTTDVNSGSNVSASASASTTRTRLVSQLSSRGKELFDEFIEGKEEMNKERETRGALIDNIIAEARSTIANPNLREPIKSTKSTMLPPIPPVKLLSATMSKQQSLRASDDDHIRKKQHILGDLSSSTGPSRSAVVKSSSTGSVVANLESSREPIMQDANEIRMDHARSCFEAGDYSRARELLLEIPGDKRTVKTYLLLIQLLRIKANLQAEDSYWAEIARMQPLALEAYIHMLRAGKPVYFVANMIPKDSLECDWMRLYLEGLDSFYGMNYEAAHKTFTALDEVFPQSTDIKLRLALCLRWMGKHVRACLMYSQVRKLDSYVIDDMYHYGACLKELYNSKYLNKLASDLLSMNDRHPDTWCVQAMYWDMKGERDKALQLVSRALQLKPDHCGALQLRGLLLQDSSPVKALSSFRDAYKIEKDILTYEEACKEAEEAKIRMPGNAQAIALYGMALYHAANDEVAQDAQDQLREALRIDPSCKLAAQSLLLIYDHQRRYDEAIDLLDQQIDYQPPDVIHIKKAEIFTTMERWEEALSSYERARSFNPDNIAALEGLTNVEKILSGGDEELDDEQDLDDELEIDEMDVHQDESPRMRGQLDEDDILTGEEDQGEEYDDDLHQGNHRMQSPQYTPYQQQRNGVSSLFAARARALAQQPQEEQIHNRQLPMPAQTPTHSNRILDASPYNLRQSQPYVSPPQQQPHHQLQHRMQQGQQRHRQLQHHQQMQQDPQQHRYATAHRQQHDNLPSSSGYPQTPSRSMVSETSYNAHQRRLNSQREREYDDEQDDGDDDMIE
ncbi:Anaphase-promoting complex subunit 7 [Linnemannia exigua]|uniref:Anaphase-promoting complex subunit 7 n=1 Tax=Linnemannia exigua TaxID=604196 RepID=A0AAD4H9F4_9FUNG|nr:Anaphase-promoting complex subunit 7 [Linnemannia exigua]